MTVPTNAEGVHFRKPPAAEPVLSLRGAEPTRLRLRMRLRGRRPGRARARELLIGGVVAVGFGVVALVLVFPRLASPIGTAAGVVAVLVPLLHRAGQGDSSDGGSGG
ncbi:hypothetical protein JQK87_02475 [Streptomyces sp. G44]|uniref:hypothetical protein n=1 Tax=Streptomyces sp. G44 TaxID=2807632 RepID=UPI00195F6471|nr:hypothetical protein [Streptomyces sp. G44]MBM7167303.1 hypothetical protein [Streptomyces sp. G44]